MENAVKKKLSPKVVLLIAIALIALFAAALVYQPNEKETPEPEVDITVTLKKLSKQVICLLRYLSMKEL